MKLAFGPLALFAVLVGSPAYAVDAPLVSDWSLTNEFVPTGPINPRQVKCSPKLRMSDSETELLLESTDRSFPQWPGYEDFQDINGDPICDSPVGMCMFTSRPLNGDVWALNQVICQSHGEKCQASDVRNTVTASPKELVVRMDCRNCPTAVVTWQCTYKFVSGAIRKGTGPRVGSEEGHHHGGADDHDDDHDHSH
jgi:hypothetical protein